ncbi:MAG: FAD:protein FMN transferase [candidate division WOR-3 bacterium]|nr:FAD:protein FMN transferase [candidate division WOR-3 bacterium]
MRRLIPILALLFFTRCGPEIVFEETKFALGTCVTIKAWGEPDSLLKGAVNAAFREIDRIDSLSSVFSTRSAVYQLNQQGKIVSAELAGLIGEALEVSAKSGGTFDPTVMPLIQIWGFYDSTGCERKVPSEKEIEEVLALVDYRMIGVSGDTIKLDLKRAKGVDLSGIAKGYAVDRAVEVLRREGVKTGLVDAGGDIFCFGERKGGWRIGIRNPRSENPNDLLGIATIDSGAVATSGDYENFFELDGVRYHHLIDPATGMPAREAISATVIAPTATQADAWATALFVMGENGIAVLDSLDDLEGMIVLEDGEVIKTRGFPALDGP